MLDLSVLRTFNPVSLSETKNSSGEGISFESQLDPLLNSGSPDADELAKIIEKEAAKSKDEAEKLQLIERSLAYVRAKGGSDLSLQVYENLTDNNENNGFIDVFGKELTVPKIVRTNPTAMAAEAWEKIMSGAAYDHIEENKNSIVADLKSARSEAEPDDKKIFVDNPALVNLKEQLVESGMSLEEADEDISKMLREIEASDGVYLLEAGESVQISNSSTALSAKRTDELERLRDELTREIDAAATPEEARLILEDEGTIDAFERLRPENDIEPEQFYTQQMQAVLDESTQYNGYTVAAVPSLEKITVDGEELIKTTNDKVFVSSDGKFVNNQGEEYEITDDKKIIVDGAAIDIEDIKPPEPEISILMDESQNKVEDESLDSSIQYMKDRKLVYQANGDMTSFIELDRTLKIAEEVKEALPERREREEQAGLSDNNNTLTLIMGIISAIGAIVAALSQGGGSTTTVTDGGGGYNRQDGYGYGSYYPVSDKYGYNRGRQATINAADERHGQYREVFLNNPVQERTRHLRTNGMRLIQGQDGGPGVMGYTRLT